MVDRLEQPDPALEQDGQAIQVAGGPHQGVEPLDADDAPAEALRIVQPARMVIGADQQTAGELGLDPRDELAQRRPRVGLPRPVLGVAVAREDRRPRRRQSNLRPDPAVV